jgi:6-phosphogluconolactonase/glucosamine-6-phosphate isomerase/deaminase
MIDIAANSIADFLQQRLHKNKVLLLLSGGSAIQMYAVLIQLLERKDTHFGNLTCSLFDERWVPIGSQDSNEQQLQDAGIIQKLLNNGSKWIPYLAPQSKSPSERAEELSYHLKKLLSDHQLIILAGIGEDGHTAGLLPTKDPKTIKNVFESKKLVEYYELPSDAKNLFRERITATPHLVKFAEQVFIYAPGENKVTAIKRFHEKKESIYDCPSIALHLSKHKPIIFSDM